MVHTLLPEVFVSLGVGVLKGAEEAGDNRHEQLRPFHWLLAGGL